MLNGTEILLRLTPNCHQLILLPEVIHAPNILKLEVVGEPQLPISPDISLPWSEDYAHDGWSAKMFLHQLLSTSLPHWRPSNTEQLLSEWTPQWSQGNPEQENLLSDAIKPIGMVSLNHFASFRKIQGLLRRRLRIEKSWRLYVRTKEEVIPVIISFTNPDDCESWMLKSAKNLPDFLADGLLDYLKQHAPECMEIPLFPKSPNGLDDG